MANNIFDYDVDGLTRDDGSPVYYENADAIKNAFSFWLTSKKGDFIKNPNAGGLLDTFLFKSLKKENLDLIGFSLQNEISLGWKDVIYLNNIVITPDYTNRVVQVEVNYTIIENSEQTQVTIFLDKQIEKLSYTYQTVEYIEENLYNFVNIQKVSYKNEKLVYNTDMSSWVWGKFVFSNLTESDPFFEDILSVINTT